jgi:hypothetical protein
MKIKRYSTFRKDYLNIKWSLINMKPKLFAAKISSAGVYKIYDLNGEIPGGCLFSIN